jgi:hypothetical protein
MPIGAIVMSRVWFVLAVFAFTLASSTATWGEPTAQVPAPWTPKPNRTYGIEALLSMPKETFAVGEPITVTFSLKNMRSVKQYLQCRHAPYGNGLIILDAAGHQVHSTGLEHIGPLTVLGGFRTYYGADPGEVVNCVSNVSIVYWGYRLEPGTYSIRATWTEIDLVGHEPIASNALTFSVTP